MRAWEHAWGREGTSTCAWPLLGCWVQRKTEPPLITCCFEESGRGQSVQMTEEQKRSELKAPRKQKAGNDANQRNVRGQQSWRCKPGEGDLCPKQHLIFRVISARWRWAARYISILVPQHVCCRLEQTWLPCVTFTGNHARGDWAAVSRIMINCCFLQNELVFKSTFNKLQKHSDYSEKCLIS